MQETMIDLRPLVHPLVRQWRLIVLAALLAGLGAGVYSLSRQPTYEAQTQVAIVRLQTEVDLQSNFKEAQTDKIDPAALRAGLVSLGRSGAVAQDVITALGEKLPAGLREPRKLINMVTMQASGNTSVLHLSVAAPDAELATLLTTAWGKAFVARANAAFGIQSSRDALNTELRQARTAFEQKQTALSQSPLTAETARLERQTTDLANVIEALRYAQLHAITMTLEVQATEQAAFLSAYSTAFLNGQTAPLEAERQAKLDQLTQLYATRSRLSLLREDVRAFRDQVQRGAASGSALAYSLLKAQLFAGSSELPLSLQIQAAPSETPSVADLDALLASTDTRLTALEQTINQQVASFRDGTAYELPSTQTLSQTNQAFQGARGGQQNVSSLLDTLLISTTNGLFADERIREVEGSYQRLLAEFEQKKAQLFVLTQERDLAQTTYTALSTRVTELEAANAANDTVVRLVGDGVLASVSRHTTRNVGIAMLAALVLSTFFVLFRTFWPQLVQNAREPILPRRAVPGE